MYKNFSEKKDGILVPFGTQSGCLIVFRAIHICTVVKRAILALNGPTTFLISKVPVEAGERPVLRALVLQKLGTLLRSEVIQIPTRKSHITSRVNMQR